MKLEEVGTTRMRKTDQLQSCLNSALDRKYCFVKMSKTHCNIVDQDKGFVEKAWREAVLNLDEN